jgi:hypothetical protein
MISTRQSSGSPLQAPFGCVILADFLVQLSFPVDVICPSAGPLISRPVNKTKTFRMSDLFMHGLLGSKDTWPRLISDTVLYLARSPESLLTAKLAYFWAI